MQNSVAIAIVIAVVAEGAAALLVAIETAISRISVVRAAEFVNEGRRGAPALVRVAGDPRRYITSVLFVRVALAALAVVLVAILVSDRVASRVWAVVLATLIMWVVNFIVLGVAPRTLGQQHAAGLALRSAGFVKVLGTVMAPITKVMILIGNALTPGKGFSSGPFASEAEIRAMLDQAGENDVIAREEQRMLASVFELGDTMCRELMVPRTEMVYIERHNRLPQALSLALRSGFSRIPVIGESLDDVVGVLHIKDLMARLQEGRRAEQQKVSEVMRPALLAPDTKRADEMLRDFQATRTHQAVLIDEYGGTAGLVTVEDIVEEIVGEISDEYDTDEIADLIVLGPDDYRVHARMPLDDLSELTGLDITDDSQSVDTVAGLLGRRLGVVPIPGSEVRIGSFILTAETAEGRRNRVSTVRVRRAGSAPTAAPDSEKVAE